MQNPISMLTQKSNGRLWIPFMAIILIIIRLFIFGAQQDIGLELDSSWYLGVSRNIALRGIYASYANHTNDTHPGASFNTLRRFTVQDTDGYSYFPAGVTVGPGYIIPQTAILMLLGHNYFAYKIFPFMVFAILILLLFFIVYRSSGLLACLTLYALLWARPDLYINQVFDGYSESLSLLYAVGGLLLLTIGMKKNNKLTYLVSGVLMSCAVETKLLALLMVGGFGYLALVDLYESRGRKIIYWIWWTIGFFIPVGLYEGYRYLYLISHFGIAGYTAINEDIKLTMIAGGSGSGGFRGNFDVFLKKLFIWRHLNIFAPLAWTTYLTSIFFTKHIGDRKYKYLIRSFWVASSGCFAWYLFISPSGWFRHAWFGVILSLVVIIVTFGTSLNGLIKKSKTDVIMWLCGLAIIATTVTGSYANLHFFMTKSHFRTIWHEWFGGTSPNRLQGPVFSPLLSWKDQNEAAGFITSRISRSEKIYYVQYFVTEMATLSDRVFFPVFRYLSERGTGYLILGPYQKGFASYLTKEQHDAIVANYCDKVVFSNPSYTICHLYEISRE